MQVFRATLEARDPSKGCFRAYQLEAYQDLFGTWVVDISYGRIGTLGRHVRFSVMDEEGARQCVTERLKRRASARRRIGVPYRICELVDPQNWINLSIATPPSPADRQRVVA
ncbi:MAG: WGR domain-containing protein [Pirellulaceae bacterium]|nr:WGR domain-containing protein [Planctomycetales bacterium]